MPFRCKIGADLLHQRSLKVNHFVAKFSNGELSRNFPGLACQMKSFHVSILWTRMAEAGRVFTVIFHPSSSGKVCSPGVASFLLFSILLLS